MNAMKIKVDKIPKRVLEMMMPCMELNEVFGGELSHCSTTKYKGVRVWRAIYFNTLYSAENAEIQSVEVCIRYNKNLEQIEETVKCEDIPLADIYMALDAMQAAKHKVA